MADFSVDLFWGEIFEIIVGGTDSCDFLVDVHLFDFDDFFHDLDDKIGIYVSLLFAAHVVELFDWEMGEVGVD